MMDYILIVLTGLGICFFIIAWLIGVVNLFWNYKINKRLYEVDRTIWDYYHTIIIFGKKIYPTYSTKMLRFLFTTEACNDKKIASLKKQSRVLLRVILCLVSVSLIAFLIAALLWFVFH